MAIEFSGTVTGGDQLFECSPRPLSMPIMANLKTDAEKNYAIAFYTYKHECAVAESKMYKAVVDSLKNPPVVRAPGRRRAGQLHK